MSAQNVIAPFRNEAVLWMILLLCRGAKIRFVTSIVDGRPVELRQMV